MSRPSIDQLRGVQDFASLFRWYLTFPVFPSGITADPGELNLRCESAEIPKLNNQKIETNIRGHKTLHAGICNYTNTLTLTFVEDVANTIHNFIREWRELIWETSTGVQKEKSEYEAIALLTRLNNQDKPIWEYRLIGCFPEDYEPGGTLDGATSDFLKPSLVLSYDYFKDQAL